MDPDALPPSLTPPIAWRRLRGADLRCDRDAYYIGFGTLKAVGGPSADSVFAVGEVILRSRDHGETWEQRSSPPLDGHHSWYAIWCGRSGGVLLAGDDGVVRSRDGGDTWERCFEKPVHGIWGNDGHLYAIAWYAIYHSGDQGNSWQEIKPPGLAHRRLSRIVGDATAVYVTVWTGSVLKAQTGGEEFAMLETFPARAWRGVEVGARGEVYVVANSDRLLCSRDRGTTWADLNVKVPLAPQKYPFPIPHAQLDAIGAAPTGEVYVVGGKGVILRRGPNDEEWRFEASGTLADLSCVWSPGGGEVYAVGADGVILRRL